LYYDANATLGLEGVLIEKEGNDNWKVALIHSPTEYLSGVAVLASANLESVSITPKFGGRKTFFCRKISMLSRKGAAVYQDFEFGFDKDTGYVTMKLYRKEKWKCGWFGGDAGSLKIEANITKIGIPETKSNNRSKHRVKLTLERKNGKRTNCARNRWFYYNDVAHSPVGKNEFQQILEAVLYIKHKLAVTGKLAGNDLKFKTKISGYKVPEHPKKFKDFEEADSRYFEQFHFLDVAAAQEIRKRRRRLVYCPNNDGPHNGDNLCTQADLDEFGPDSPGLKALLRRRRRLVYRPIHRLAELILAKQEEDKPP